MNNSWRLLSTSVARLLGRRENADSTPAGGGSSDSSDSSDSSGSSVARTRPIHHDPPTHASSSRTDREKHSDEEDNVPDDLLCPICQDVFVEVVVTACGHTFCNQCITQHMSRAVDCPICRSRLNPIHLFPNFQLSKIVERYREDKRRGKKRIRASEVDTQRKRIRTIDDLIKKIPYEEFISIVMPALEQKKKEAGEQKEAGSVLMEAFLEQMKCGHKKQIASLQSQLEVIEKDLSNTRAKLYKPKESDETEPSSSSQGVISNSSWSSGQKRRYQELLGVELPQDDQEEGSESQAKRQQLYNRFQDLQDLYIKESCTSVRSMSLDNMSSVLYQSTQYSSFRVLDTILHIDPAESSSITSSIEFDRDNEFFAVTGVSRDIKIFDYGMIADPFDTADYCAESNSQPSGRSGFIGDDRPAQRIHCPSQIIHTVSSDYKGVVKIWDTNEDRCIRTFAEHTSRTWSVDVSAADPTLLASGSDDGTVKIWSTAMYESVMTLHLGPNVCSAKFAPSIANYLAVGTADHIVSYYDLRYPDTPVHSFQGHKRAVSYVRWLNDTNIISASTDSTLRRWNTASSEPTIIYSGHKNEKNFVGLSVSGDWISCGSEDNHVYAYHKDLMSPIASFSFPTTVNPSQDAAATTNNKYSPFVTSSCWKRDSNILLTANSKGIIKVLQLDK